MSENQKEIIMKQCFADPTKIRNVCIIAHVDHGNPTPPVTLLGKTTFSDSLLSSNAIISKL